ncbi:MAG: hypothetical protein ACRC7O_06330, partial [Fimbriiglobus sp.]
DDPKSWAAEFGLPVSARHPAVRTAVHWCLTLGELYGRNPHADRYAVFQDDFVVSKNARAYLDTIPYAPKTYRNLYTFPSNQKLAPRTSHGGTADGFYPSNQLGRGAVALVFDRETTLNLLGSDVILERPQCGMRGWRAIDGGIVTALKKKGWAELVHSPSLTQHTGKVSSMGNRPHHDAESFRGEDFDCLSLLPGDGQ